MLPGLRSNLASVADEAQHIMVVTDADGVVLWRDGCNGVRHRADALGFAEGAAWTETAVGTNAIGTALVERAPVQLFSAEHYQRSLHPWTCGRGGCVARRLRAVPDAAAAGPAPPAAARRRRGQHVWRYPLTLRHAELLAR